MSSTQPQCPFVQSGNGSKKLILSINCTYSYVESILCSLFNLGVTPAPAFNILLSLSQSAEPADMLVWEIFGILADTLLNVTIVYSLSIVGQIDWYAWLTFRSLANTCPRIPVCWFLHQHIFWHAWWDKKLQHDNNLWNWWRQLRSCWRVQAQRRST